MTLYQFVLLLALVLGIVYVQLRYAWARFPKSRRWKLTLFISSFAAGSFFVVLFGYPHLALGRLLIAAVLGGLFFGLIFTFLFPEQMQVLYPNRNQSDDLGQK